MNDPSFLSGSGLISDPNGVNNTTLYVWNCGNQSFSTYYYWTAADALNIFGVNTGTGWYDASGNLITIIWSPGEGMILYNNTPTTITLNGTPAVPVFPPPSYCGCNRWSFLSPQTTNADNTYQDVTGFAPQNGAQVSFGFPTNGVISANYTYQNGNWSPNTPILTNGEAALFYVPCVTNPCPQITNQPQSITVCAGQSATFTVGAAGTPPLSYQWYRNASPLTDGVTGSGSIVAGSQTSTLTLIGVSPGDQGYYLVVVANSCGSVTSAPPVFLTVLTNSSLTVECATNKTVPCGSNWTFDTPTNIVDLCCSNWSLSFVDLTNNVQCPLIITRTWTISDACGNATNCSQTVTVTNVPMVINCPTNRTIPCTSNLVFDLPVVASSCCGTNYSINILGDDVTTNLDPCTAATTRTWLITDCCGMSNFCTQTITMAPAASYTITLQPGYNLIANQLNNGNNSANILFPNAGQRNGDELFFYDLNTNCLGGFTGYLFDSLSASGFDNLGGNPISAPTLSPGQGVFYLNNSGAPETVTFTGAPDCTNPPPPLTCPCGTYYLWSRSVDCFGTFDNVTGLIPQEGALVLRWNGSGYTTYTFTGGAWAPTAPVLNVGEAAFFMIPCPTNPCITLDCTTNKTVPCGSTWSFDNPTNVVDHCCSNSILGVAITTVTNSTACAKAITRTWLYTDVCGHSNTCSQTVTLTGCCTNGSCCGTNAGARMIKWIQCPLAGPPFLLPNPSGANAGGTWIITNLPCYGNVLITQTFPDNTPPLDRQYWSFWYLSTLLTAASGPNGAFNDVETGYGPYSWGAFNSLFAFYDVNTVSYQVNFYFLNGPPNPCTLYLGAAGLGEYSTATVSQPVVFRAEYDQTVSGSAGISSAYTTLNGIYGPTVAGSVGTIIGSAFSSTSIGSPDDTGLAVLQPTNTVTTVSLPYGSGLDMNGNSYPAAGSYPCLSLAVSQAAYDGLGFTIGYVCCTNASTNCIQVACSSDKTVPCGSNWTFDTPTNIVDLCCSNWSLSFVDLTNNVPCPLIITRTWTISDACGNATNCSQTVTVTNVPPMIICPSSKTIPCASSPVFDMPVVTNSCCGTNAGFVQFGSDVSGGTLCAPSLTRTWLYVDCCGNSNFCSQTVTFVDTNRPVLAGLTNKSELCGNTWGFDVPTVTDPCGSTNFALIGLTPVTNGLCPKVITETWVATNLCNGLTATASQIVTQSVPNSACTPLVSRPGIQSVTVWEVTGADVPHTFPIGSAALQNAIPGGPNSSNFDFASSTGKYYDVYLSDPDGTPDTNGCCVTVVCYSPSSAQNYATGDNIDAIELNFSSGPAVGASSIGSVLLGSGINNQTLLASDGGALNALGLHDGSGTSLGDGLSHITLCFPADCSTVTTNQCGTAWNFNPPPAYNSCCGSNVTVTVLNTITNGTACDLAITRTWEVTDCCGNKSTCNETVYVVDTTPPVVTPKTNIVPVAFNSNCDLVIPKISVNATDNCTKASQLVYSQFPTNGTIVSAQSTNVTVWVTDLCNNSNSCQTLVVGVSSGPVISGGPTSLTVTNCLVPCVTNLFTIHDCPTNCSITVTQSPACDTVIGPGYNSVTVYATDCNGKTANKTIQLNVLTPGSFMSVLYNTGVAANKALLSDGAIDPHYTLGPVPIATPFTPPDALAVTYPWNPPAPVVSKWITPNVVTNRLPRNQFQTNAGNCPYGYYVYTNQFVLPNGTDPNTASISGRWLADDAAGLFFNSAFLGAIPAPGFKQWHPLQINSGFLPYPYTNTILFVVTNVAGPGTTPATGLRVEYTNAIVCSTCAPPTISSITSSHSVPNTGVAAFSVATAGTLPMYYQWYYNGALIPNTPPYSGANSKNLVINPVQYSNAGLYTVVISNACGSVTGKVSLTITVGRALPWGWWNVGQLDSPLAATYGPDLGLVGTNVDTLAYSIFSGTSDDLGLPEMGGQAVNVMDVAPLSPDAFIQIPLIAPTGTNSDTSYSLVMDIYEPDTSSGTNSTLFQSASCCISNLSSGGQDGLELTLDAQNFLHLDGSAAGVPFNVSSASSLPVDAWNRLALVVNDPQDGVGVNVFLYLNGQPAAGITVPTPTGLPINWSNGPPSLFSSPAGATAEFDVSSIQFFAEALSADEIAGLGSPDSGPLPGSDNLLPAQAPVLSAATAGGIISLSWTAGSYVLQESSDLTSGEWTDSGLDFSETLDAGGNLMTTAPVNPSPLTPVKFYRLIFRP